MGGSERHPRQMQTAPSGVPAALTTHLCLQEQHVTGSLFLTLEIGARFAIGHLVGPTSRGPNRAGVTCEGKVGVLGGVDVTTQQNQISNSFCGSHDQVQFSRSAEKDAGDRFKDVLYFLTGLNWLGNWNVLESCVGLVVNFESINSMAPLHWCKTLGEITELKFSCLCWWREGFGTPETA